MPMANFFGWEIMSKKRAALTGQEIEAIKNYVNNPNKKLIEAKQFLDSLDDLRKAKVIPTTLVAFEVLKQSIMELNMVSRMQSSWRLCQPHWVMRPSSCQFPLRAHLFQLGTTLDTRHLQKWRRALGLLAKKMQENR